METKSIIVLAKVVGMMLGNPPLGMEQSARLCRQVSAGEIHLIVIVAANV
jgi:hypothetical protein